MKLLREKEKNRVSFFFYCSQFTRYSITFSYDLLLEIVLSIFKYWNLFLECATHIIINRFFVIQQSEFPALSLGIKNYSFPY